MCEVAQPVVAPLGPPEPRAPLATVTLSQLCTLAPGHPLLFSPIALGSEWNSTVSISNIPGLTSLIL